VFFSTLMVLSHLAIKSFDLVMALTAGGPGFATDVPATFMYTMSFSRGQIGLGAASATMMLATVAAWWFPTSTANCAPNPMTAKPSLFPPWAACWSMPCWLLAAAFFLLPLYAMLVTSFKDARKSAPPRCWRCPHWAELVRLEHGVVQRLHGRGLQWPAALLLELGVPWPCRRC
jgi:ABC-type sugar transport system permease subunit